MDELIEKAAAAKRASVELAQVTSEAKDRGLRAIAQQVRAHEAAILAANAQDCARADERIALDRLRLTPQRIASSGDCPPSVPLHATAVIFGR